MTAFRHRLFLVLALAFCPIAADAHEIGVKVRASFHDALTLGWSADGRDNFRQRTMATLLQRLAQQFAPAEFTAAEDASEFVLEITVEPDVSWSDTPDYALLIDVYRVLPDGSVKNRLPIGETFQLWTSDRYPQSSEEAAATVIRQASILLRRGHQVAATSFDQLAGRRLPVTFAFTDVPDHQGLLNEEKLVVEPLEPSRRPAYSRPIDNGVFPDGIELPPVGRGYKAHLRFEPRTQNVNSASAQATELCIRTTHDLTGDERLISMHCRYGDMCEFDDPALANERIRLCEQDSGWLWPDLGLIGSAHAQPRSAAAKVWYAPSLRTLWERRKAGDVRGVGYTLFTLAAPPMPQLAADAFVYEVAVNGTPVHFAGLPPAAAPREFDPELGFELQFGLENLNFRGRHLGCDRLAVTLTFLKGGEPVGEPVRLQRPYVALRDADAITDPSWPLPITWSGRYKLPKDQWEYELIVGEDNFDWFPPGVRDDLPAEAKAAAAADQRKLEERMQWNRGWIDKQRLPGPDGTRLVGVLRPPLSIKPGKPGSALAADFGQSLRQLAYGIVLGLEDPASGQVRFTFTREQRAAHRAFFEQEFAELAAYDGDDAARRAQQRAADRFSRWLIPPQRWRNYQIGSNDAQTPPGFCERLPVD